MADDSELQDMARHVLDTHLGLKTTADKVGLIRFLMDDLEGQAPEEALREASRSLDKLLQAVRGVESFADYELSDGGCIEYPDNSGELHRRDVHGNCEEVRRPGEEGWAEWIALFPGWKTECANCGTEFRPGPEATDDNRDYCSEHCYCQSKGERCPHECGFCDDNEV